MFNLFPFRTLQVEVTTACNLDCGICLRSKLERTNAFLSLSTFKHMLDPRIFRYVGLHGWGEPLLNPDVLAMIKHARSKGVITNLTTNGTLLADRAEAILGSGLEEIAFGVYDRDQLAGVLPNIRDFIAARNKQGLKRPRAYFDITIYRENQEQVEQIIRLASDIGLEALIVHRLFNLYGTRLKANCLSPDEERVFFKEMKKLARSLKMELYLPRRHTLPCLIVKRSIFVTVQGKVTPCTYLPEECLGDVFADNFKDILKSYNYHNFIRNMKKHPVCGKCRW